MLGTGLWLLVPSIPYPFGGPGETIRYSKCRRFERGQDQVNADKLRI